MSSNPSPDSDESATASNPESGPEDSVQETAPDDQATTESGSARKILIGSQRDVANPALRAARTLQNADLAPERTREAIRPTAGKRTTSPPRSATSLAEPPVATTPAPESEAIESAATEPVATEPAEMTPTNVTAAADPTDEAATTIDEAATTIDEAATTIDEAATTIDEAATTIDEAATTIDDELEAALDDLQMDSLLGGSPSTEEIELDSRIKGLVSRIHNDNVFFSLKGQYEGIASLRQFKSPPQEGAMLEVIVTGFKEDEGLYEVSVPGAARSVADWSDLNEGAIVNVKITGSNTGGLECNINNIRGFIPASQIDVAHVENFGEYVNQKLQCVVTEVNPRRKRLVLSRRAILERESQAKKKELLETLEVGQTLDGIVTRLMDFGAFVDIGGTEGLVHISKLSWDRVTHPKEVLETGQKISVKVEKIDAETGKIGLSLRDTQENPWAKVDQKYPPGAVVDGTVSRIAQFGAFVKLESGIDGLVHISELAHHRVIAVKNVVSVGDLVQVKVLTVDPGAQKIGLSLKATQAKPEKPDQKKDDEETAEPARELAVKRREEPLKGGRGRSSGGEQFGLNL